MKAIEVLKLYRSRDIFVYVMYYIDIRSGPSLLIVYPLYDLGMSKVGSIKAVNMKIVVDLVHKSWTEISKDTLQ